jgi:hypothetical protein
MFPIKNGLNEGDALSSLLFSFALEYAIRKVKANHSCYNSTVHIGSLFMLMMLIYRVKPHTHTISFISPL